MDIPGRLPIQSDWCQTPSGNQETRAHLIHQLKGGHMLSLMPVVVVAGQQERLKGAGHTSWLDRIHLCHMAFMKKHLPAFFNAYLVPNHVFTIIQWRRLRWMVRYYMSHHQLGVPRPSGDRKIFQGFTSMDSFKRIHSQTIHWHTSYSLLPPSQYSPSTI